VALYDRRQLPSPRKAPALEVQRRHAWLRGCPDEPHTLIAVRDDATKRLLYAQPWPAESTVAVMTALRTVFTRDGLPVALYTDRAGWAFHTPQAGGRVDRTRLTQVGRALAQSRICINSRCVTISCQCGRAPYPVVETKGLDEIQPPIPGSTVHGVANSAALPAHPCRSRSPAESLRDVSPENDGASKLEEDDGGGSPTKDKPGPVKRSTDLWITASKVKGSGERERQTP
jgi:hypothetical protein